MTQETDTTMFSAANLWFTHSSYSALNNLPSRSHSLASSALFTSLPRKPEGLWRILETNGHGSWMHTDINHPVFLSLDLSSSGLKSKNGEKANGDWAELLGTGTQLVHKDSYIILQKKYRNGQEKIRVRKLSVEEAGRWTVVPTRGGLRKAFLGSEL